MRAGTLQLALLAVSLACFTAIALAVTCGDLGDIPLTGCSACVAVNKTLSSSSGDSTGRLPSGGGNRRGRGSDNSDDDKDDDQSDGNVDDANDDRNDDDDDDDDDDDHSKVSLVPSCTACDAGFVLVPGSSPQRCGCPPGQGANLTGYKNTTINKRTVSISQFTCGPCDDNQVPFTPNSSLVPFFNGTDWILVLSNSTDGQMAIRSRKARLAALMANRGRSVRRNDTSDDDDINDDDNRNNDDDTKPCKGRTNSTRGGGDDDNDGVRSDDDNNSKGKGKRNCRGKNRGKGRGKGKGRGGGKGRGRGGGDGKDHGDDDGKPPKGGKLPWFPGSCVDCPVGLAPNADKTACVAL